MDDYFESKKNKKRQKRLYKELQLAEDGGSGNSWEKIDMKKKLHPIGYYMSDREEMIRQIFTVIQGDHLKKMLPPILKDMDLNELKADCLMHLVGMSSKRVQAVLEGADLDISSEESESDELGSSVKGNEKGNKTKVNSTSDAKLKTKSGCKIIEDGCSVVSGEDLLEIGRSNSDFVVDDVFESQYDDLKSPVVKKKKCKSKNDPQTQEKTISSTNSNDMKLTNKSNVDSKDCDINTTNKDGKTLLEILELEMRARAIRALLKQDDTSPSPANKENSSSRDDCNKEENPPKKVEESVNTCLVKKDDTLGIKNIIDVEKDVGCDEELNEKDSKQMNVPVKNKDDKEMTCENMSANNSVENVGNSWAERWLEKKSKDVKRLVTTSKMCTTIRNKMKRTKLDRSAILNFNKNADSIIQESNTQYKGSIEEYENLCKTSAAAISEQPAYITEVKQEAETVEETKTIISASTIQSSVNLNCEKKELTDHENEVDLKNDIIMTNTKELIVNDSPENSEPCN